MHEPTNVHIAYEVHYSLPLSYRGRLDALAHALQPRSTNTIQGAKKISIRYNNGLHAQCSQTACVASTHMQKYILMRTTKSTCSSFVCSSINTLTLASGDVGRASIAVLRTADAGGCAVGDENMRLRVRVTF
jgi:hypothetical protein